MKNRFDPPVVSPEENLARKLVGEIQVWAQSPRVRQDTFEAVEEDIRQDMLQMMLRAIRTSGYRIVDPMTSRSTQEALAAVDSDVAARLVLWNPEAEKAYDQARRRGISVPKALARAIKLQTATPN